MKTFIFCCLAVLLVGSAFAANSVDIRCESVLDDTLRVGWPTVFDIWIENDVQLYGISMGFVVWSPDGVTWQWDAQPDSYEPGPSHAVTVIPGCRIDPPTEVLDMTSLVVYEYGMDGALADSMHVGGLALFTGVPPGDLEHMLRLHLTPTSLGDGEVGILCIDSGLIPPAGTFVFTDEGGGALPPTALWPEGGLCFPVTYGYCVPGDANNDGVLTVGDAVYLLNHVLKAGPAPAVAASADANIDCEINVGDVIFLINHIFKGGPAPQCSYCVE